MDGGNSNFAILQLKEPQLFRLGALAEHYFSEDPNTCHIKLRQFSELAAQLTASRLSVDFNVSDSHSDILRRLKFANGFPKEVSELFHALRVSGNEAAHELAGDHSSALTALKIGRQLAIWYLRTFYSPAQKFGPFVPPSEPLDAAEPLRAELGRLQLQLAASLTDSERAQAALQDVKRRPKGTPDRRPTGTPVVEGVGRSSGAFFPCLRRREGVARPEAQAGRSVVPGGPCKRVSCGF